MSSLIKNQLLDKFDPVFRECLEAKMAKRKSLTKKLLACVLTPDLEAEFDATEQLIKNLETEIIQDFLAEAKSLGCQDLVDQYLDGFMGRSQEAKHQIIMWLLDHEFFEGT